MQIESTNGSYRDLDVQAIAIAVFKDEKADDDGFLKELDSITGGVIKSVIDSEELKDQGAAIVTGGCRRTQRVHIRAGVTDGGNGSASASCKEREVDCNCSQTRRKSGRDSFGGG